MSRGRPITETAEEASFLLSCGESPEQVLSILGMSAYAASKACGRAGYSELATLFESVAKKKWSEYA